MCITWNDVQKKFPSFKSSDNNALVLQFLVFFSKSYLNMVIFLMATVFKTAKPIWGTFLLDGSFYSNMLC